HLPKSSLLKEISMSWVRVDAPGRPIVVVLAGPEPKVETAKCCLIAELVRLYRQAMDNARLLLPELSGFPDTDLQRFYIPRELIGLLLDARAKILLDLAHRAQC